MVAESEVCDYKVLMYDDINVKTDDEDDVVEMLIEKQDCESTAIRATRSWSLIVLPFICLLALSAVVVLVSSGGSTPFGAFAVLNEPLNQPSHNEPSIQLNHQRWAKVLQKLASGKQITMGFHGGSITFQPWAYHTQLSALLTKSFPVNAHWYVNDTKVYRDATSGEPVHQMISHAAPAMTSDAASLCVTQSFVTEEIDVIGLEYAVNDHIGLEFIPEGNDPVTAFSPADNIERFARGYLNRPDGPAIMMPLFSFEGTRTAENAHMKVALHYGIPTVSWSNEYSLEWRTKIGAYSAKYEQVNIYDRDPIHPNADGHHVMAQLLHAMIQRMYNSYITSNAEDLAFSPSMSRRTAPRQSLLQAPPAPLPEFLNPAVQWTSSPKSFCRLMFRTFWGSSRAPELDNNANIVAKSGISWHPGYHPDWKASFRPDDIDASVGQSITLNTTVPFERAAVLFIFRTWNTTWANGTVHLSSSTQGKECNTKPVRFESTWKSPSTQVVTVIAWSALADEVTERSCVRDLITVTKISTGDMRITGFYAN